MAHDAGLSTALYASKSKFDVFARSWVDAGAPHPNGAAKIDRVDIGGDTDAMAERLLAQLATDPARLTFVHFREPDTTGHDTAWDLDPESPYLAAVARVDAWIGEILDAVLASPVLRGDTAILVTADHAGELGSQTHLLFPPFFLRSGVVGLWVWGPGVAAGADLHALNPGTRLRPEPVPEDPGRPSTRPA